MYDLMNLAENSLSGLDLKFDDSTDLEPDFVLETFVEGNYRETRDTQKVSDSHSSQLREFNLELARLRKLKESGAFEPGENIIVRIRGADGFVLMREAV